jgi:hypothetical protein
MINDEHYIKSRNSKCEEYIMSPKVPCVPHVPFLMKFDKLQNIKIRNDSK